jgi:chemotaxis protein MotA
MTVIIGLVIVLGAVIAGFTWAGGHVGALLHPSEFVTIGGASLGALIMMSPKKVLTDLVRSTIACLKGSPFNKAMYSELFQLSYRLLCIARRDGLLSLERHVADPHKSDVINSFPKIAKNHHVVQFMCDGFFSLIDGATPEQLGELLESDMKVIEEEHHAAISVLQKTADALPGFGIVAAVLGIVITMGAIDGPVEEVGHKVGAALVGTFLGILMSYGMFGPLAARMEFMGAAELAFFRTIMTIVLGAAHSQPPKAVIEGAIRGVATDCRPNREELEAILKDTGPSAAESAAA